MRRSGTHPKATEGRTRTAPIDADAIVRAPSAAPPPTRAAALRALLPRGRTLSDEDWWHRHRAILVVLWLHAVGIPLFARIRGYDATHGALEALPVAIPALLANLPRLARSLRTQAAAFGLLSSSAVLVHLSGGTIEMHFHFFVMVTVVALYQEWFPFLMAIGYVFLHHGLLGLLDATSVYNHQAALNDPWKWAAIHAVFISGISAVCLITWRVNEAALLHRKRAEEHAERLYELERSARSSAEASGRRLEILSETSRVLVSSLDVDATLAGAAGLWVPAVADLCAIDLLQDDGSMRRIVALGSENEELIRALARHAPDPADERHPVVRSIRSRRPRLMASIGPEDLAAAGADPDRPGQPPDLRPVSAMIVPLAGREGILGAVSLVTTARSGRELTADDLALAEELARRTAAAVENAMLYARERGVAESLQRSLLPERLPAIPGLDLAVRYSPGGPNLDVGGDWYDVSVLPGGAVAFALGDVVGRGLPAAALMGQLRNALRAYALDGMEPTDTLDRLNRLLESNDGDHLATLIYGVFDPGSGTLRLANAGHPPPLVLGPDGSATFVEEGHCLPLGAMPFTVYTETVTSLAPGATLVLYTDGLVEDRENTLDDGLRRLAAAARVGPKDARELCDHLFESMTEWRRVDDDVALLVMRPQPLGNPLELRVPSQARMLASVRATLRRWLGDQGATEEDSAEILLACGEACANAVEHASSASDTWFDLIAEARDEDIQITVRDRGGWRAPRPRGGGRGLQVIEALSDRMQIVKTPEGSEVRIWHRLGTDRIHR